jgi:hypothetical protein
VYEEMKVQKNKWEEDEFIKMEWKKREKGRNGTIFPN